MTPPNIRPRPGAILTKSVPIAGMAELADAADSKSADRKVVGVRPPLPAPIKSMMYQINASSDAFFCAQTVPKVQSVLWLR